MELNTLCRLIQLPQEVTDRVLTLAGPTYPKLTRWPQVQDCYDTLKLRCMPQERGLDMLAWMLTAGLTTYENYRAKGIPDGIFVDTMKCFTRFVNEHMASFGCYGFDRGFWTVRQLSMVLFRVGELEYEFVDGAVSMHIPSDARLSGSRASLEQYRSFAREFYPDRAEAPMVIESWLLSPALKELLDENSNILRFQRAFRLEKWLENDTGFLQWVYGREDIPAPDLPETTSLQRRMKQHLLAGGKVGSGEGTFIGFQ